MFGLGMPELAVIGGIMLLIFGPGKLPQLGASLGGAIKSFRTATDGTDKQVDSGDCKKDEEKKING